MMDLYLGQRGKRVDNFATKNILWRASLETLDFVPLNSANYAGGMIISDWYQKLIQTKV